MQQRKICNGPLFVTVTLSIALSFTTILYYFAIPNEVQTKLVSNGDLEVNMTWGTPDSEFNWCEADYQIHPMVAELYNSVTSFLYIAVAVLGYGAHCRLKLQWRYSLTMLLIALIGIGSTLFHATLRYQMQLLDELPMHYLIMTSVYNLWEREVKRLHGRWFPISLCLIEIAITFIVFSTHKTEQIHDITRGFVTCSFSIGFIYILTATAIINEEISKLSGQHSWLFQISFIFWMIAIVCWIVDILFCTTLRNLPFGLPYPQLHAFGWHLCGSIALYFTSIVVLLHHELVMGRNASIIWYGCLPIVQIIKTNEKTLKKE